MGQFLQTNGDYNIKTREGGVILLDTGPGVGNVRVTGNLVVEGDTLTVSAENLNVNDNVIILNFGETGAGVSLRYSGIQIDRGTESPYSLVYDENFNAFQIVLGNEGGYTFENESGEKSRLKLKEIITDPDTDDGDLLLIGTGSGVVKVSGTLNYETQITDDDDIPNKKYVDDAIRDNPTFQVLDDDTRLIVTDKDVSGSLQYFIDNTSYSTFGESAVSILVDGVLNTQFFSNRVKIQGIEIQDNVIKNVLDTGDDTDGDALDAASNIYLSTYGTGKVVLDYALMLEAHGLNPGYVPDYSLVHGGPVGIGTTGLYFVNDSINDANVNNASNPSNNDTRYQRGELISKNKALLFSMLF